MPRHRQRRAAHTLCHPADKAAQSPPTISRAPLHRHAGGAAGLGDLDARHAASLSFGLADVRGAVHAGFDEGAWITTAFTVGQMMIGPVVVVARRGVRRAPRADDLRHGVRASPTCCCRSRPISLRAGVPDRSAGFRPGTFIPLTIGFVVLNLPPRMVVYGVAAYSLNLELSLNIAASIEGWFCDNWSWQWIFWDTALLAPLMCVHLLRHAAPADQSRAAQDRRLVRAFSMRRSASVCSMPRSTRATGSTG